MFYIISLFLFGMLFGSFSTVLIERWNSGKSGIMLGRSECPKCNTQLNHWDLIPIFSYIFSLGKCRYCKEKISLFYPIAELFMGSLFAIAAYSAIKLHIDIVSLKMLLLLICTFATGVYVLYDIKYMEIPDQIMVPIIGLLLAIPFFSLLFISSNLYTFHIFDINILERLIGALILYTFFYIQILIPGSWFLIKNKDFKHLKELLLGYITFPFEIFIDFFRKKKEENTIDIPTWVGGGDLRIAIFIGLTLGIVHGIMSFVFAYIIGSIIGILLLIINFIRHKKTTSQIPFGPFLALGWILAIIFYSEIENYFNIFI